MCSRAAVAGPCRATCSVLLTRAPASAVLECAALFACLVRVTAGRVTEFPLSLCCRATPLWLASSPSHAVCTSHSLRSNPQQLWSCSREVCVVASLAVLSLEKNLARAIRSLRHWRFAIYHVHTTARTLWCKHTTHFRSRFLVPDADSHCSAICIPCAGVHTPSLLCSRPTRKLTPLTFTLMALSVV